jgi:hypothetical protein
MEHIAQIDKNLFLGSLFSVNPEILQHYNITHIFHFGFEIPKPILDSNYLQNYCKEEYFNLEDTSESVEKMLQMSFEVNPKIDKLINANKNVLVCCVAGKSRSASIVTLYLHHKYPTLSYEELMDFINKKRSISLNPGFGNAIKNKINNK